MNALAIVTILEAPVLPVATTIQPVLQSAIPNSQLVSISAPVLMVAHSDVKESRTKTFYHY